VAISGFLGIDSARVTEGSIRFKGEEIQNRAPHLIAKKGIALVPEREKIFETLKGFINILRVYTDEPSREKVEKAAVKILGKIPTTAKISY
jgi:branched-chain amino acid transport system ATP-binding protein